MDEVRVERVIDLPREIVWEALVDPVLVEGWLHPVERLVTRTTPVVFVEPELAEAPAVLRVVSPAFGDVSFSLSALPAGKRGSATALELVVDDGWGSVEERRMLWSLRVDQLEELLRGRPVDWASWSTLHSAEERTARAEAAFRSAR